MPKQGGHSGKGYRCPFGGLDRWPATHRNLGSFQESPATVLTDLIGVLLRIIYDALFWARNLSEGGRERPLLLVLEEAHSYLSETVSGSAASAVRRIVKEGRKLWYRCYDRKASVQPKLTVRFCRSAGPYSRLRLANPVDRGHVTNAAPDNLEGLFADAAYIAPGRRRLSLWRKRCNCPIRTLIDPPAPNRRPDSEDPMVHVGVEDIRGEGDKGPGGWNRKRERSRITERLSLFGRKQRPRLSPQITDNPSSAKRISRHGKPDTRRFLKRGERWLGSRDANAGSRIYQWSSLSVFLMWASKIFRGLLTWRPSVGKYF